MLNRHLHSSLFKGNGSIVLVALICCMARASNGADESAGQVDFVRKVQPILERRCFSCHGPEKQEGGLRLDVREEAFRGGDSGPAIVARRATDSLVIQRIRSADKSERMPLDKTPLDADEINLLRRWIEAGANWPAVASSGKNVESDHWSFQPIRRPGLPAVNHHDWVCNPIDAFVMARLEAKEIAPAPEADRATLLRRLHLDLTGLPTSPQALNEMMNSRRPDAYERFVDQLLASPHFGERCAQPWLDLSRYADSDGYEMDYLRPNAWRWRDWVIQALNSDVPFDRFTVEQIAGDLLPDATWREQLATGFHRNTPTNTENGIDKEEFRVKAIVDRVNTTGTVWLGLTIGCAECHSHKYDPIRQSEYYSLFAFFNNRVDEADVQVEATPFDVGSRIPVSRKKQGKQALVASAFRPRARPRETHVHLRGSFLERGARVHPDVPKILPPLKQRDEAQRDRLDLARWLVDSQNPLTARVEVNRICQQLFGVGLVRTPNDFGTQGEPPSHPLLLDWLAAELPRRGWSRKAMIRLIVSSATYRQASALRTDLADVDPMNRLLARQNRLRLDAELIRDQYLASSQLMNSRIGGPSFHPPLPDGMSQIGFKVVWKTDPIDQQYRRGMYIVTRRNLAYPMLTTFDRPDANVTCVQRERSNSPLQSLTQMNDPLMMECARSLAARILKATTDPTVQRIERAFMICLSRRPTKGEVAELSSLLQELLSIYRKDLDAATRLVGETSSDTERAERAAWIMLARTIMNLDEFVTRE